MLTLIVYLFLDFIYIQYKKKTKKNILLFLYRFDILISKKNLKKLFKNI